MKKLLTAVLLSIMTFTAHAADKETQLQDAVIEAKEHHKNVSNLDEEANKELFSNTGSIRIIRICYTQLY
jgi:hypothetical protein